MKIQSIFDQAMGSPMTAEERSAQDLLIDQANGLDFGPGVIHPFFREQRAMTASGTTSVAGDQGGQTIASLVPEVGTSMQAASVMIKNGARVIVGATSNFGLPHADIGVSAVWLAENAPATDGSETFANLKFSPKRICATRDVSLQYLAQVENPGAYLMAEGVGAIMAEFDRVIIAGSGASGQPLGIINTVGVGTVVGGTNGAAPTLSHLSDLEYKTTGVAKADRGKCAWVLSPYVRRKLRQTFQNGTGSSAIWSKNDAYSLLGHPAGVTPNAPDNLDKGSSAGVCSSIAFGEHSEVFAVFFGPGITFEITKSVAGMKTGFCTIIVGAYVDAGLRTPKAFTVMNDALAA
jgi:HK97 family phage major capsid protein